MFETFRQLVQPFSVARVLRLRQKLKPMTKLFSTFSLCLLLTMGWSQETRSLSSFDEVSAAAGVKVILTAGNETKAVVEVENCEPGEVITEVRNGRLYVKFKDQKGEWKKTRNRKATITVHYRSLNELDVSSGAYMSSANPIRSDDLELGGSSGGQMVVSLESSNVDVDVSSGSIVEIEGTCGDLDFEVSSGGVLRGYELRCRNADGGASSGGVARIHVSESLDAHASSGGSIAYKGNPRKTDIDAGFSGSIKSKQ